VSVPAHKPAVIIVLLLSVFAIVPSTQYSIN
jgi:hypothetical protein